LNGILSAAGSMNATSRIVATYFSFCTCLAQLAFLIVSGALIFAPYAVMCQTSMVRTAGENIPWTMSDDY